MTQIGPVTYIPWYICFFFHPLYYPRTTLALPPSSNSDPGSHSGPSSPLPTTVRAFIFIAGILEHFSSLVDWRRIVPTHAARRSQQLILFMDPPDPTRELSNTS